MGFLKNLKELLFSKTPVGVSVVNAPLKLQAVWSTEPSTIHFYVVKYENNLTPAQMSLVLYQLITYFSPDCRPANLTVSVSTLSLAFYSGCISGERMKDICEKVLGTTTPTNRVKSVMLDGSQIWPLQSKTKK